MHRRMWVRDFSRSGSTSTRSVDLPPVFRPCRVASYMTGSFVFLPREEQAIDNTKEEGGGMVEVNLDERGKKRGKKG